MAANKTVPTKVSATEFFRSLDDATKRKDSQELAKMMREITHKRARMWGTSIVGFGEYHFNYASGREGDFMLTGFSPRKQNLTVYIMPGFDKYKSLLSKLGKHKHSKSCLYVKKLDDIDRAVLYKLIARSVKDMKARYKAK